MDILQGLLTLTAVHLLATVSPGPDFVLISKQALSKGRNFAFLTLFGTVFGLFIHIGYSAFGFAALIVNSPFVLVAIKVLGGGYLIYLGIGGLRAQPQGDGGTEGQSQEVETKLQTIRAGFICDVLNPKGPVYYVSLFTFVLSPNMPYSEIALYALWMIFIHFAWFSLVILLLSAEAMNRKYKKLSHWFDRVLGGTMVVLGGKIILSKLG